MKTKTTKKPIKQATKPMSRENLLRSLTANIETLCLVMTADILDRPTLKERDIVTESIGLKNSLVVPQIAAQLKQKSSARTAR